MLSTEVKVTTAHAGRYLKQLSKHWSHKFDVAYDDTRSVIPFAHDRKAELIAGADHLFIRISIPDEKERDRMRKVIEDHLNRFAFREALEYAWT